VRNSIFWDNSASSGPEICLISTYAFSSLDIAWSNVKGGQDQVYTNSGCVLYWGEGMIDADPLWIDSTVGDYHLFYDSPCRDSGDATASGIQSTDFEGDPRIAGDAADMGADEFHRHLYYLGEAFPGGTIDIRIVGPPSTSPVWLGHGGGILDPPRSTPFGALYLLPPIIPLGLGPIPGNGVLTHTTAIPGWWNPGEKHPFQTLVGQELTNLMAVEVVSQGGGS